MPGRGRGLGPWLRGGKAWSLGSLSPLIWTRADTGVTVGTTGTVPVDLTTWTSAGATAAGAGPSYTLTADVGAGTHEITVAATTVVAGYEEITVLWTPGTAPFLYLRCGATGPAAWFKSDGTLGTGSGTGYVTHTITPIGGGVFLCSLHGIHVAANTERIGIASADNTTASAGGEVCTVRAMHGFDLGTPTGATATIQQRVLDWVDARGTAIKWTQTTAADQPLRKRDAVGRWCLSFLGAQHLTADSLAAGFSGDFSMIAAIADVPRSAAAQVLWCAASDSTTHYVYLVPNQSATTSRIGRRSTAGSITEDFATTRTSGVIVERFGATAGVHDGTWGDDTVSEAQAGAFTPALLTFGALRFGTPASISARFIGAVYDVALLTRPATGEERAIAISKLTTAYGLAA